MDECATLPFDEPGEVGPGPEEWRPVVGYEGYYEVSSGGRVRSIRRPKGHYGNRGGGVLCPATGCKGDFRLTVHLCVNGQRKAHLIHRLVMAAFVGPCPKGMEVLHGPAGTHVNTLSNLRYGTHRENIRDKYRDGTALLGEKNHRAILTAEKVREIRERHAAGTSSTDLAPLYGVSRSAIMKIVRRKSWRHVA